MGEKVETRQSLANSLDEEFRELAAAVGQTEALRLLRGKVWELSSFIAGAVARKTVARYRWLVVEDLQQQMLLKTDHFAAIYDSNRSSSLAKHLWWKFSFYIRDVLRCEDPLGVRYPQRERYPDWYRLGEVAGRVAGDEAGGGCDVYVGNSLVHLDGETDDGDEQWSSDLAALEAMRQENSQANRLPSMVDDGDGVCRAAKWRSWWSKKQRRARLRFSKKCSIFHWRKDRKKRRAILETGTVENVEAVENVVVFDNSAAAGADSGDSIFIAMEAYGKDGATSFDLAAAAGVSLPAAQAKITRMKRDGDLYIVATKKADTGRGRVLYSLAKFWPDGPPIQQKFNFGKPAKKTAKPARKLVDDVKNKSNAVADGEVMALVRAVKSTKGALKKKLLDLLVESVS